MTGRRDWAQLLLAYGRHAACVMLLEDALDLLLPHYAVARFFAQSLSLCTDDGDDDLMTMMMVIMMMMVMMMIMMMVMVMMILACLLKGGIYALESNSALIAGVASNDATRSLYQLWCLLGVMDMSAGQQDGPRAVESNHLLLWFVVRCQARLCHEMLHCQVAPTN